MDGEIELEKRISDARKDDKWMEKTPPDTPIKRLTNTVKKESDKRKKRKDSFCTIFCRCREMLNR